jgi:uncharacterized membrane protein (UPF0127 family)
MKIFAIAALLFFYSYGPELKAAEAAFKKAKIQINNNQLEVELAENSQQQAQGLMFRKKLGEGKGMLFIFSDAEARRFWMKNTFIPLSIAFFDEQKSILNILDMKPAESEMQSDFPTYDSVGAAKYALEVPVGWFQKHKIKVGDKFTFVSTANKTPHK